MFVRRMVVTSVAFVGIITSYNSVAEELSGTFTKIKREGSISIGYRDSSVPFSYLDADQRPVGYALDICDKIVEDIRIYLKIAKLEAKLVPVTSSTRIPLIANGTIDLECGSTTNNADRQKQVSFTNSHYLAVSRFAFKKKFVLKNIEDLRGKAVVSTAGSLNVKQINELNIKNGLNMTIYNAKDHAEAFLMLETERAYAFIMDDVILSALIANSKNPGDYEISEVSFSKPEPYGIMLSRGDPTFKMFVDEATRDLYTSEKMMNIYNKWFTSDIPPKKINMNLPISSQLRKQFEHPVDAADPDAY